MSVIWEKSHTNNLLGAGYRKRGGNKQKYAGFKKLIDKIN
jgi:hypothetical protein